jgi:hypothetical protein
VPLARYVWLGCAGTEYEEGQWLWRGPVDRDGYGRVIVEVLDPIDGTVVRREFRAHKAMYEAYGAAFPELAPELGASGTVGHECVPQPDRRCCNAPKCLRRQSWSQNAKQMWANRKARTGTTRTGPRQKAGA